MSNHVDVSWIRNRAQECLLTAQEADREAASFWNWLFGERRFWRKEAAWWRAQQGRWNDLADELEAAAVQKGFSIEPLKGVEAVKDEVSEAFREYIRRGTDYSEAFRKDAERAAKRPRELE